MEIKAKTFKDKLYEHSLMIAFIVLGTVAVITLTWQLYSNKQDRIATQKAFKEKTKSKIETIKKTKPTLTCKGEILKPQDYDMMLISDMYFIVTEHTIKKPSSLGINDCDLYINTTNSYVPKPTVIIPIDIQHEKQVKSLKDDIVSITEYRNQVLQENVAIKDTLDKANSSIVELKELIDKQDKELLRLSIIEAKHTEIKQLLTLVLEKKNISLKQLIIKPVKPKPKKVVTSKAKKINPLEVPEVTSKSVMVKNNKEYLQRILYTIRFLSKSGNRGIGVIPPPTEKQLSEFNISEAQIKNFKNVKIQLLKVIDNLSKFYGKRNNVSQDIRLSVRVNVGI